MKKRRLLLALLTAACMLTAVPALAAEDMTVAELDEGTEWLAGSAVEELPDREELFAGYVLRAFDMAEESVGTYAGAARPRLNPTEQYIYDGFRTGITQVAAGELSSTVLSVNKDSGFVTVTAADLNDGETLLDDAGKVTAAAATALQTKFHKAVDINKLLNALVGDHPYELYWYDKTANTTQASFQVKYKTNSAELILTQYTWKLPVSSDFRAATLYEADTAKTGATKTALENAQAIVTANAGKTDYEKLVAYRDKICELVEYDFDAMSAENSGDGSKLAWQIISVFDGDPNTKAVCEGYGRAFQYLCDRSVFSGTVECYSVIGTAKLGAKAEPDTGGHLWNVVAMDGKNYLVDVTNSDGEAVGKDGTSLFLAGATAEAGDETTYRVSTPYGDMYYAYYAQMKDLYCDGYLALSATAYAPPAEVSYPVLAPSNKWYKSKARRDSITKIEFVDSYTPDGTENEVWNADAGNTGAIKGYRKGTEVIVAGDGSGGIKLSADASFMFGNDNEFTSMRRFTKLTALDISLLDTSAVTDMRGMFYGCSALEQLDLSDWNTEQVKNMSRLFYGCTALKRVNLNGWNTSNVTDMGSLFYNCASLTALDLSHFDIGKLKVLGCLFYGCTSLESLNLSGWDTSAVTAMSSLFAGCSSLTTLDLSGFNTANVVMMNYMFSNCEALTKIYVSDGWSVKKVTSGLRMFLGCKSLKGDMEYTVKETDQEYATAVGGYLTWKSAPTGGTEGTTPTSPEGEATPEGSAGSIPDGGAG